VAIDMARACGWTTLESATINAISHDLCLLLEGSALADDRRCAHPGGLFLICADKVPGRLACAKDS
jgi:hypothetical protein